MDIERERKRFDKYLSRRCLFPVAGGVLCDRPAIDSHRISRAALDRIAVNQHVIQLGTTDLTSMYREQPVMLRANSLGINQASTLRLFCKRHDKELFAPIEDLPFEATPRAAFLFHYRAICRRAVVTSYVWQSYGGLWSSSEALARRRSRSIS